MNDVIIKELTHIDMEQILELYKSVQWNNYTRKPTMLESAIRHSLKVLAAYIDDKLIGIIRVVGDGHSIIYIQDLIISPDYQRRGIGRLLVKEIDLLFPHVYQKVLITDKDPQYTQFYKSCGYSLSDDLGCVALVKFNI